MDIVFILIGLAHLALAQCNPVVPTLQFLGTINFVIQTPINIAQGEFLGRFVAVAAAGGSFVGPYLNGTITAGIDRGTINNAGVFSPDGTIVITDADGENVVAFVTGRHPSVQALFETPSAKYAFLNNVTGIGYVSGQDGNTIVFPMWMSIPPTS